MAQAILSKDNSNIEVDSALSTTSTNPVQNKVITQKINSISGCNTRFAVGTCSTTEETKLTVNVGWKPDLVLLYSDRNHYEPTLGATNSEADYGSVPRILTSNFAGSNSMNDSGMEDRITSTGFQYSLFNWRAGTLYYIAIKF